MPVYPTQIVGFIDEVFPFARRRDPFNVDMQFRDRVSALLRLVDELPSELLTISGSEYNRYVTAVETLRSTVQVWGALGPSTSIVDRRNGVAICDLRDVLDPLPDEVIPPTIAELTFIDDPELRESIREDMAAADAAHGTRQWKSVTVMAGAAAEALLLWRISQCPTPEVAKAFASLKLKHQNGKPVSSDPDDWTLEIYRRVARKLGIIQPDADDLIKLAQQYRNLIHPGRARRTGRKSRESTALTALAAVKRLVEDFS